MAQPIIFHVTVDGISGRVVLNPTPEPDSEYDHLVVEIARKDAAGGTMYAPMPYRDTKRFIAAALFHAALYGARPGDPIEVGKVERSAFYLSPPAGARLAGEFVEPKRLLEEAAPEADASKGKRKGRPLKRLAAGKGEP